MQRGLVLGLWHLLPLVADAAQLLQSDAQTPMTKVVDLLTQLKASIEKDGVVEQKSYDAYACWCEDALGNKSKSISAEQEQVSDLGELLKTLKGELGSHAAQIEQLNKDIAQNVAGQSEVRAVRDGEFEDFTAEKTETEQCIGALEAAVKVLAGAGTGKFLDTSIKQAELLSVVAGVRRVLERPGAARALSNDDVSLVRRFVERPTDFTPSRGGSFGQLRQNPFGDYAPQSTQIQGILKGMYDTFVSDMEQANAKEAESQKAFESLMATKASELETLKDTLKNQKLDHALKTEQEVESMELLHKTEAQLEADEDFFDKTKAACQAKSREWSERSRLRTMELAGVGQAIAILSSPEAKGVFGKATTTFVQVSTRTAHRSSDSARGSAYARLSALAQRYHDLGLARVAASIKAGGHFDKVIESIERMIEVLRAEEQADIAHRDRCQNAEGKNSNDMADLNHAIEKAQTTIQQLSGAEERLVSAIKALEQDIATSRSNMAELLRLRNADAVEFQQSLKDDTAAIALLQQALAALTRFFEKNKIKLSLFSKEGKPTYSLDEDKAPETTWTGAKYGGRKEETGGVVAIIEMIIEDLEKEIRTGKADEAEAQKLFESQRASMQESLDAQLSTKVAVEKELADIRGQKVAAEQFEGQKSGDLGAEKELQAAIYGDCSWVATHFESRSKKRKSEMDGLVEAKGYLAGVAAGEDV